MQGTPTRRWTLGVYQLCKKRRDATGPWIMKCTKCKREITFDYSGLCWNCWVAIARGNTEEKYKETQ